MRSVSERLLIGGTVLLACFVLDEHARAQEPARVRYTINDSWKFFAAEMTGAEKPQFDDGKWERVNLPHTWNVSDTLDDEPGYRRGAGWYRRRLELAPNLTEKRLFLYFEGANQVAEVFVNGRSVGKHSGGYTAFSFELTDAIRIGKPNVIAVRVDNSLDKDIPPIDGDFNMYGGIYRDVWLVATEPIHIKATDMASSGVSVKTPAVSANRATVEIRGTVVNAGENAREVEVVNTVIDVAGQEVAAMNSKLRIDPKSEASFEQTSTISKPKLWSPEDPFLYKVRTTVRQNDRVVDEISNPLGFRWFAFDPTKGLFLNGKQLKLRGTNRHQDHAGLGNALPDALHVRDLEIIKENGFNFLRLAHYPQDPSVLEAADRLGLLIWEEIPIVNRIHVSGAFNENAKRMLREMIRQHGNHPSIIIWGYMNEVFLPKPTSEEHIRATVDLARDLEKICSEEGPARATAIAFDHGAYELYSSSGLADVPQVVGWNLYHGWYYETFADFGKFLDDQHRKFPRRSLIVSEYGANGDRRVHSRSPQRFDSSIEWQQMFHEAYLPQINARPYLAGSAIWNQFDFGSEFRGETIPHINQKGLFTYDRSPKDISYFYTAHFSKEPVLHIATRDRRVRGGALKQRVIVYSNLPQAELFVNGVSYGKVGVGIDRKAFWEVSLRQGKNLLRAEGTDGKRSVSDTTEIDYRGFAELDEIAVNVGSDAEFIDATATIWQADQPYKKGSFGFVGPDAKEVENRANVLNTFEDPLFQTARAGLLSYRFDVPAGDYEIELCFAEQKFKNAGERIFDVKINRQLVLNDMDLAKEGGAMKAFRRKFRTPVRNGDGIVIEFQPNVGEPVLSGVKVKKIL